jgi:hypothetical protein
MHIYIYIYIGVKWVLTDILDIPEDVLLLNTIFITGIKTPVLLEF